MISLLIQLKNNMDIPPELDTHFPKTVWELLNTKLPQFSPDGCSTSSKVQDLFSKDPPCGYEGILAREIPSSSIISVLQPMVDNAVQLGFASICLALHPKVLFPLWAAEYWKMWLFIRASHKQWSREISWLERLEDDEQCKVKV